MTTTWITICDTCKREDWSEATHDRPHGVDMAELVEAAVRTRAVRTRAAGPAVRTRRVSCLMGCTHGCNVAIQAQGKLAYTLGRFAPDSDAADGIVAYAELHAASDSGQVPFRQWPAAIKGHFVTRHPPLPDESEG